MLSTVETNTFLLSKDVKGSVGGGCRSMKGPVTSLGMSADITRHIDKHSLVNFLVAGHP